MANTMATMQGCCCEPAAIIDCDAFRDWWETITEAHINISGVSNNGCTDCVADLAGDWILDLIIPGSSSRPCDAGVLSSRIGQTVSAESDCVSGMTVINGYAAYRLSINCSSTVGIIRLSADVSAGCLVIAEREMNFPIDYADLMAGTLINAGTGPTAACDITGDVPYELFV